MDERITFESPVAADAGLIDEREAQPVGKVLPAGLEVVSADNHVEIIEDIFYERFPEHRRDRAPRVWLDKYWRMGFKGVPQIYPDNIDIDTALIRSVLVDGFDFAVRNRHLDQ